MSKSFIGPTSGHSVCQPPSAGEFWIDRSFRGLAYVGTCLILALVAVLVFEIGGKALPGIHKYGLDLIAGSVWDPNQHRFGILPAIWGTLYSSLLALAIGGFFGVMMAIFLTQDFLPPRLAAVFRTIIELLAAIPSVVYGLWGIFVVIPALRPLADGLHDGLGWFPLFETTLSGPGCCLRPWCWPS